MAQDTLKSVTTATNAVSEDVDQFPIEGTTRSQLNAHSTLPTEVAVPIDTPVNVMDTVLIIGAGPVGLMLALLLAQQGIASTVLEKEDRLLDIPRAIGYYGPVHRVFQESGIYDQVAAEGLGCAGYTWRSPVCDDGEGGKRLGNIVAQNVTSIRDPTTGQYPPCTYMIMLAQNRLTEILAERVVGTGLVKLHKKTELVDISESHVGVEVTVETEHGRKQYAASYLVGCDGSRSAVRRLLKIPMAGMTWPERFMATDVLRTAPVIPDMPVHFTVDTRYWAVVTPLEKPTPGQPSLWRYSLAVTDPTPSDEEVTSPEFVDSLLDKQIDGPRPSNHRVIRKSLYRMHQLLASAMYRGRCFLAGDAGHLNNPIGGLGLCTGLLDADALAQTLTMALTTNMSEEERKRIFFAYSDSRRKTFSRVISPLSSEHKTRLHTVDAEQAREDDWYFRAVTRADEAELARINRPLVEGWRSIMSEVLVGKEYA